MVIVRIHIHICCVVAASLVRVCAAHGVAGRRRLVGNLLLALPAACAHAEGAAARPASWVCWYADGASVACRLGAPEAFLPSVADLEPGASDAGALPPAGRRPLPEIVRTILQEPGKLAGRTISIPLFTEAQDMEFVRELAEAVMCGTRKLCRVLFLRSSTDIALALDALEDPALN